MVMLAFMETDIGLQSEIWKRCNFLLKYMVCCKKIFVSTSTSTSIPK